MKVLYVKTLWGVTEEMGNCPTGYLALFKRIAADGFNAIETPYWVVADREAFLQALKESGLSYVAMVNTCTPSFSGVVGARNSRLTQRLEDHIACFSKQVAEASTFNPILINSHSGMDCWPLAQARAFFEHALAVERAGSIPIAHETHRGREWGVCSGRGGERVHHLEGHGGEAARGPRRGEGAHARWAAVGRGRTWSFEPPAHRAAEGCTCASHPARLFPSACP
jgi:hypothetical protein